MGKKKNGSKKERAVVGRERRIALVLRSLLDEIATEKTGAADGEITPAEKVAIETLTEMGYDKLESITKRVSRLNEQLKAAVESGDGKEISRLGLELERAKLGKPPLATRTATSTKAAVAASGTSSSES